MRYMNNHNFLYYLHSHTNGKVSDLQKVFGEEGIRQMEAMGYIVNAPSKDGETWKRSTRAARLAQARYRKSTILEKIGDFINVHLRKVDYSI